MPWNETTPMDQKMQFIADYLRGELSMTELCEMYGISRKTGYNFLDRYLSNGPEALEERSRNPSHPNQTAEHIVQAILSHAEHLDIPRQNQLEKTLFACDELSGFVHACGLVRPNGLDSLTPKSVRKKLKQPSFAAGVHREDVYKGAEELGVDLDEHIAFVIAALRPIAPELGLRTSADMKAVS